MSNPASAESTSEVMRVWPAPAFLLAGVGGGGLGAAAYAGAESLYTLVTTTIMPLELPLARDEFAVVSGMVVGLVAGVAGAVHAHRGARRREVWRLVVVVWASITFAAALWLVPELEPIWKRLGPVSAAFVAGPALLGALTLGLEPGRLWRSLFGPERLVLAGLATAAINMAFDLQSRVLPPLASARGLLSSLCVLLVIGLSLIGCDRVMDRLGRRVRSQAGRAAVAALLPGVSFALMPVTSAAMHTPPPPYREARDSASRPSGSRRPPDIIVVVMDATRADVLTPYGAPPDLTPSLAELARSSLVYEHAVAPSSWTLPSHATLLTGLYPIQHGADRAGAASTSAVKRPELGPSTPLRSDVGTLATWLSARGYHTAAILANAGYLHPDFGLTRGFSFYDARFRLRRRRASLVLPLMTWLDPDRTDRLLRWCRTADDILSESIDWLDRQGDAPVFLLINLMEAHDPYAPATPFAARAGRIPGMADPYLPVSRGERALRPEERTHLRASYEASVQTMDHALGRFFQALKNRQRLDRTALLVTADHGDMIGEHGMLRHAREVWEPLVHVPLMLRYPDGEHRGRVSSMVHLVDVAPTLLKLASVDPEQLKETLPGRVLPLARDDRAAGPEGSAEPDVARPGRPLLVDVHPTSDDVALLGPQWNQSVACIYEGRLKYCETSRGARRLFDFESDPGEEHDLAAQQPQAVAHLSAAMEGDRQSLRRNMVPAPDGQSRQSISKEAHEQLKALGYVQ